MKRPYDEQLSALLDGEVAEAELDMLLRRVRDDQSLADRVGRYALIRDALHRNLPSSVDDGLAARVSAALADEPAHTGRGGMTAMRHRRWVRPFAGLAIAASVAMLAVVIWPTQQPGGQTSEPGAATVAQSPGTESTAVSSQGIRTVGSENIRWDRLDPDVQARLNGYALTHGEQASGRQMGIVPRQVRITGQSADQ